ncbi:MAG: transglutaminase domain-containing protein [Candidatus Thermoplasmatota archaeon]|nr:transglutaminase domain-containing protein [Candidatus Thermoplasmatota archaeon]
MDNTITYEAHPTSIRYDAQYGYSVTCEGAGQYEITYDCDLPSLLSGTLSPFEVLYRYDYTEVTKVSNDFISWNISGNNAATYELGIEASANAEASLVSDLNGNNAATLQEISTAYATLCNQYCHRQQVQNSTYIDPDDPLVLSTAKGIAGEIGTNNTFLLAKALFRWLKEQTAYQTHPEDSSVQPARTTFLLKTGDCDDLSFLYISLCRSIGIPARFIRGYLIEETNGIATAVSHAWAEVFVGGSLGHDGWISVECACPSQCSDVQIYQNFAIESAGHLRLFIDDGSNESLNVSLSGPRVRYGSGVTVNLVPFVTIENFEVLESKSLTIDENSIRTYTSSS